MQKREGLFNIVHWNKFIPQLHNSRISFFI